MARNEEYYRRYESLCSEVGHAYYAAQILEALKEVENIDFDEEDPRYLIVLYFCEIAKQDLAMTVWRVFFDSSVHANTVHSLKKYLFQKGIVIQERFRLSQEVAIINTDVCTIRKKYIAHTDANRGAVSISVELLRKALDEIIAMVNLLCYKSVDERVEPVSDEIRTFISEQALSGFRSIIKDYVTQSLGDDDHAGH